MLLLLISPLTLKMLSSMSLVLFTWVSLALIFGGIGLLLTRPFGFVSTSGCLRGTVWIGIAISIFVLQIWNFFLPIGEGAFLLLLLIGITGLILERSVLMSQLRNLTQNKDWIQLVCLIFFVLFAVWLSNRAIGAIRHYDSGLYHWNDIRWTNLYPIVPGLGNLHSRLGFNISYFLLFSMLEWGIWFQKSHHVVNGFFLLLFGWNSTISVYRILRGKCSVADGAGVFLLVPLTLCCLMNASDTSADLPVFILGAILGVELMRLREKQRESISYSVFLISLLAVAGLSCKLNFAAFGGASLLAALYFWKRNSAGRRSLKIFTPAILVFLSWIVRGVILSGYPLYPFAFAQMPVSWKIPEFKVRELTKTIENYGRMADAPTLSTFTIREWFPVWISRITDNPISASQILWPSLFAIAGIAILCFRRNSVARDLLWLLPAAAAVFFWFITSPDPRFAGASIWLLGAGLLSVSLFNATTPSKSVWLALLLSTALSLSIFHTLHKPLLLPPGPDQGFYPVPQAKLKSVTTNTGLSVFVPVEGKQCWDSPLPCSPDLDPKLEARDPKKIEHGFILID